MELLLNEQQTLLAETAARLCRDTGGPRRVRALKAAGEHTDRDAWRAVVEAGWIATVVGERHGGLGLGMFDLALAVEEAGRNLLMVPLVEAAAAAWALSQADAAFELAPILSGAGLVVPAIAAPFWRLGRDGRDDAMRYDPASSRLAGTISFVPHAGAADAFLIAASGPQPVVCRVPANSAGMTLTTSATVDGSSSSTISCVEVEVPPDHVIARGEAAETLNQRMQDILALGVSVELIGLSAAALAITLDYTKIRHQFGRPIGSFQALQHRAVNSFIDIELNRSLAYRVLAAYDAGEHNPAMVSAVKARATRAALETVRAALQMHGAIGYTEEHDIGLYYKRAIALAARYGGELSHAGRFSILTVSDRSLDAAPQENP